MPPKNFPKLISPPWVSLNVFLSLLSNLESSLAKGLAIFLFEIVPKPRPNVKSTLPINLEATIYSAANNADPPKSLKPTATWGMSDRSLISLNFASKLLSL